MGIFSKFIIQVESVLVVLEVLLEHSELLILRYEKAHYIEWAISSMPCFVAIYTSLECALVESSDSLAGSPLRAFERVTRLSLIQGGTETVATR